MDQVYGGHSHHGGRPTMAHGGMPMMKGRWWLYCGQCGWLMVAHGERGRMLMILRLVLVAKSWQ